MNAKRYGIYSFYKLIINDFMDELVLQDLQSTYMYIWCQQDGATCHSTMNVKKYLDSQIF